MGKKKVQQQEEEPQQLLYHKRKGPTLKQDEHDSDSLDLLNLQFMFLDPDQSFQDGVRLLLATQLQGTSKEVQELSYRIATDPKSVIVGFQGDEDEINICSITALLGLQDYPELRATFKTKLQKHGIKGEWSKMSLLINSRLINCPPQLVPQICKQLESSQKKVLVFSKAERQRTKKKIKVADKAQYLQSLLYPKFQDFLFLKHAQQYATFDSQSREGQPFLRIVALLTPQGFKKAVLEQADWLE